MLKDTLKMNTNNKESLINFCIFFFAVINYIKHVFLKNSHFKNNLIPCSSKSLDSHLYYNLYDKIMYIWQEQQLFGDETMWLRFL